MSQTIKLTKTLKQSIVTCDVLQQAKDVADICPCPDYNSKTTEFKNLTATEIPSEKLQRLQKIQDSILDSIGNTPLVRVTRFQEFHNLHFELLAKCEFMNPGGSIKDRMAVEMVRLSEEQKKISKGYTLIEPSSGNTGTALCLVSAVKGYNMIVTMPQKMSAEKSNIMTALGGEVVRTPSEAKWNDPTSHISLAYQLQHVLPNSFVVDQYQNPGNPLAHYSQTAEEIIYQCDGKIDYIVITAGSCGTIAGVSAKLKEKLPNTKIIGVDPYGSILAQPESLNSERPIEPYQVEGIGYDFVPSVLDRSNVDFWIKTDDDESFCTARDFMRLEGILIGGSSGSALAGVLKAAKHIPPKARCVVVLVDSARNYSTKFISNEWMADFGFYPQPKSIFKPYSGTVEDLCPLKPAKFMRSTALCVEAIQIFRVTHTEVCVVMNDDKTPIGIVDVHSLIKVFMQPFSDDTPALNKTIETYVKKQFNTVSLSTSIQEAAALIERSKYCVVEADGKIIGILTAIDVAEHLLRH